MKAIKITNPQWVAQVIGDRIGEYSKVMQTPGITYQTLVAYFAQCVQYGGDRHEFWCVFDDDDKPVAFGSWLVLGLPYIGVAHFDHVYKWSKSKQPIVMLVDEYVNFCKRNRCPTGSAEIVNEKVFRVLETYAKTVNAELMEVKPIRTQINFYPEKEKDEGLHQNSN